MGHSICDHPLIWLFGGGGFFLLSVIKEAKGLVQLFFNCLLTSSKAEVFGKQQLFTSSGN